MAEDKAGAAALAVPSAEQRKANLAWWHQLNQPDPAFLRAIKGGRLKGFTDINPQWRVRAMTELFGPCGIGWAFEVGDHWESEAANGERNVSVLVKLAVKVDGEWSKWIPQIGSALIVDTEKGKLHSNEEAYKQAVTNGLGKCMSYLGVAADVYLRLWDGAKQQYLNDPTTDDDLDQAAADWDSKLDEVAADGYEALADWWADNKEAIKDACGDERAAEIWERYKKLRAELKPEED